MKETETITWQSGDEPIPEDMGINQPVLFILKDEELLGEAFEGYTAFTGVRMRKGPHNGRYRDFQWWIRTNHSPYSDWYNGPKLKQWKLNADQILWWAIRPVGPINEETPQTVDASEG